jgi:hypothetical protein
LLSFPQGTEMFQFPWFPLPALCVQTRVTPHDGCRVSPFGHPRINAWSTAPRGFSQSPTSFIGSRRQGIHRWLLLAWKNIQRCSCSLCSSQGAPRGGPAQRSTVLADGLDADDPLPHNGRENEAGTRDPMSEDKPTTTRDPSDGPPVHQLGRCLVASWPFGQFDEEHSLERR